MHLWKQRAAAIVVLCVLAGLPIATAICGAVCETAESAAAVATADYGMTSMPQHHHGAAHTDRGTLSSAAQRISPTTAHECRSADAALLRSEAALPGRGEANMRVLTQSPALVFAAHQPLVTPLRLERYDPARLESAPAGTSLVLRV